MGVEGQMTDNGLDKRILYIDPEAAMVPPDINSIIPWLTQNEPSAVSIIPDGDSPPQNNTTMGGSSRKPEIKSKSGSEVVQEARSTATLTVMPEPAPAPGPAPVSATNAANEGF